MEYTENQKLAILKMLETIKSKRYLQSIFSELQKLEAYDYGDIECLTYEQKLSIIIMLEYIGECIDNTMNFNLTDILRNLEARIYDYCKISM